MAANLNNFLLLDEALDENTMFFDDDDEAPIFGALLALLTRRDRLRNENFFETTIANYPLDDFQRHFRMTRHTMEKLARVLGNTGAIPQGNSFGRAPIPLAKHVMIGVWYLSNSETIRSVSDRFDVTLSSLESYPYRVSNALIGVAQEYIKWPNVLGASGIVADGGLGQWKAANGKRFSGSSGNSGESGVPLKQFPFFRKFSSGRNLYHLQNTQKYRNFHVNGVPGLLFQLNCVMKKHAHEGHQGIVKTKTTVKVKEHDELVTSLLSKYQATIRNLQEHPRGVDGAMMTGQKTRVQVKYHVPIQGEVSPTEGYVKHPSGNKHS
ncbi:predicted protein [Nematostella vectensis]|uniref:Nuclease HARBI1 n=1 Tax=Nematostella vectensis TaxID=45351 RepID=A7SIP6_NEMVE|nr:predicted protein [Nematostella vectensis]|eukprot:XP_001628488.1 predicted protein [Nematostella vectensis]